jgi:hypothetical protein
MTPNASQLSTLFDFKIIFKPSTDYVRLSVCLHVYVFIVACLLALKFITLVFIVLFLCCSMTYIIYNPVPQSAYLTLSYQVKKWILLDKNNQESVFDNLTICVDGGFFMLLKLTNANQYKLIVIFYDQLSKLQSRNLHLQEQLKN